VSGFYPHDAGTPPAPALRRTLTVDNIVIYGEGMGIVSGAPWHTQDAVAERTEAVSP
jgi:hypothetical protein